MKIFYCLLIVLLTFLSCDPSQDEPLKSSEELLVGSWIQSGSFISSGGPQYWVEAENGSQIEFFKNKKFSSNLYPDCTIGVFAVQDDELQLKYSCLNFNPILENDQGFITFRLEMYSDYFLISPTSGPICIEGCSYKFIRSK